jgi:hypothetical protein
MADISTKDDVIRRLDRYPKEALAYFQGGFSSAASLSDETRRKVLAEMISNFQRGTRRLDSSNLQEITGLSTSIAEQVASVYSLVIGLLSETTATPDEFVQAAVDKLFLEKDQIAARSIVAAVCEARGEINQTVARTQLAGEVLPSLYTFDVAVDLRVRVEKGSVVTSVPVAVLHIDTDADNHEIWLQLTKGDIDNLIRTLTKTLQDMQVAEGLAPPK